MRFARVGMTVLAVLVGCAGVASAQSSRPPVEIGVGVTGLATVPYEDFLNSDFAVPSLTARVTVPMSPRFSFDGAVDFGRKSSEHFTRWDGLYLLQVKQRLESTTRGSFHAFLSYGLAGYYAHRSQKEVRTTLPNGQVDVTPAYRDMEWEGPAASLIGGGVQFGVGSRASIRAEAQMVSFVVIPLGVRFAGSVSIPIGSRR